MSIEFSHRFRFGHPVGHHLLQAFLSSGARHRLILQVAPATKPKELARPLFVELILSVLTLVPFFLILLVSNEGNPRSPIQENCNVSRTATAWQ